MSCFLDAVAILVGSVKVCSCGLLMPLKTCFKCSAIGNKDNNNSNNNNKENHVANSSSSIRRFRSASPNRNVHVKLEYTLMDSFRSPSPPSNSSRLCAGPPWSTAVEEANQWLRNVENKKASGPKQSGGENNKEIDVKTVQSTSRQRKQISQSPRPAHVLQYQETKIVKRGIALSLEQIVPGIWHSTSSFHVAKAVQCLVDDILRLSHSCAMDRCDGDAVVIDMKDVRAALLKKDEFEIRTNLKLGTDE